MVGPHPHSGVNHDAPAPLYPLITDETQAVMKMSVEHRLRPQHVNSVPSVNMDGEELMSYTTTGHQGEDW